jgi:hypothetical protein
MFSPAIISTLKELAYIRRKYKKPGPVGGNVEL